MRTPSCAPGAARGAAPVALAMAPLLLIPVPGATEPAEWTIDPEHFSIVFAVEHLGYQQQLGLFLDASGAFRYDPDTRELHSGRVEVRADSVFSDHDARDDHVRGDDFMDADDHPVVTFRATGFSPNGDDDSGTLSGDLTLLGETHPVELQVTLNKRGTYPFGHGRETLGLSAGTTIRRSRWGMDYGVAGDLVGDEVTLRFEFEAIRE
jgi:polyisoprenoid-binding protein YceI